MSILDDLSPLHQLGAELVPLMIHTVVLKHVQAFTDGCVGEALMGAIGEPRRIAVCQDREHAGRSFSLPRVD